MRVCDAAVEVLRETQNDAVMWGDTVLLYQIAERAGMKGEERQCFDKARRVLNALTKQPRILLPRKTALMNGRVVRLFRMPTN